jgi:hypothetical protein
MVRPSVRTATISSSVTRTALISGSGWAAVFVPRIGYHLEVVANQTTDAVHLVRVEAVIARERQGLDPELAGRLVALSVIMHRLAAIEAVEEQTVWTWNSMNRRQSGLSFAR